MAAGQLSPTLLCKSVVFPGLTVAGAENAKWQEVRTSEPETPLLLVARSLPSE